MARLKVASAAILASVALAAVGVVAVGAALARCPEVGVNRAYRRRGTDSGG